MRRQTIALLFFACCALALAADVVSLPAKLARAAGYPPVGCSFDKSGSGLTQVVQFPAQDEILRVQGIGDVPRVRVRTYRGLDVPSSILEDTVRTLYSYPDSQPLVILGRPDVKLGSKTCAGLEYTTGSAAAKLHMLAAIAPAGEDEHYGLIVEFTVPAGEHPHLEDILGSFGSIFATFRMEAVHANPF